MVVFWVFFFLLRQRQSQGLGGGLDTYGSPGPPGKKSTPSPSPCLKPKWHPSHQEGCLRPQ